MLSSIPGSAERTGVLFLLSPFNQRLVRMISVDQSSASVATPVVADKIEKGGIFDGLVCTNDVLAVGVLQALLDKGI